MKPLVLILLAATASAQEMPRFRTWRASVAVLGAAQAADIASSYGGIGTERNTVFWRAFDAREWIDATWKTLHVLAAKCDDREAALAEAGGIINKLEAK